MQVTTEEAKKSYEITKDILRNLKSRFSIFEDFPDNFDNDFLESVISELDSEQGETDILDTIEGYLSEKYPEIDIENRPEYYAKAKNTPDFYLTKIELLYKGGLHPSFGAITYRRDSFEFNF